MAGAISLACSTWLLRLFPIAPPGKHHKHDGTLAGSALLDLCKVVLAKGSAEQQNALVL
jgi:hypothetical protein